MVVYALYYSGKFGEGKGGVCHKVQVEKPAQRGVGSEGHSIRSLRDGVGDTLPANVIHGMKYKSHGR